MVERGREAIKKEKGGKDEDEEEKGRMLKKGKKRGRQRKRWMKKVCREREKDRTEGGRRGRKR